METRRFRAIGFGNTEDEGCVSVSLRWRRRTFENGALVDDRELSVSGCDDPALEDGTGIDGCAVSQVDALPISSWIDGAGNPWGSWFPRGDFSADIGAKKCTGVADPGFQDDNTVFDREGDYTGTHQCHRGAFGFRLRARTTNRADGNYIENELIGRSAYWTTVIDQGACAGGCRRKGPRKTGIGDLIGAATATSQEFLP